jgi:hypothetical protein
VASVRRAYRQCLYGVFFAILITGNFLEPIIPVLRFMDEGLAIVSAIFLLYCWCWEKKLRRYEAVTLSCLAVMTVLALVGNTFFNYQPSAVGILKDMVAFFKMPITLLAGLKVMKRIDDAPMQAAVNLSRVFLTVLFVFGILSLFVDMGMSHGVRRGIPAFKFLYSHPTYLVYVVVLMVVCIVAHGVKKLDYLFLLEAVAVLILTQRDKGFAFVALLLVVVLFLRGNRDIKLWHLILVAVAALAISLKKILDYASWSWSAREAMYGAGLQLMLQCFPLGSGFATFGNSLSGEYYSGVYELFGLNEKPGLNPIDYVNLSDAQWPYYMGQFGVLGMLVFLVMLGYLFLIVRKRYLGNMQQVKAVYLIAGYLMVASLVETVFTNESGVTAMIIMLVFLGGMPQSGEKVPLPAQPFTDQGE